ncbi:MAG TPA: acyl-CoA dehydrogenase family protein [Acidimicrobiales bacterium]|nr:acyl-CoA dehydrogenase family protein [Acidimicrobiales bacterium]
MDLTFTEGEQAFRRQLRAWLDENVEPTPAFGSFEEEFEWGRRWQARLAADRWVAVHWPVEVGGRGASSVEVALYNLEYARSRAPQPVNRSGLNLAGPTLLAHGTEAQQRRWLPGILDASEIWCQLFSEPGAGSDLAALSTRAVEVEGGWLVTGQKVWTSYAQFARWGIALVRTDPEAGKHRGISYVVMDMTAPGIDVRPLTTITGEAEFNEVFMDEVFVPSDHLVGGYNSGWAVANTTLAHERGTSFTFKEQVVHEVYLDELCDLAERTGALGDVAVADALSDAYVKLRILRLHNWRTLTRLGHGEVPGAESSISKLAWTDMTQTLSDAALAVLGAASTAQDPGLHDRSQARWQRQWLWSKAASIAGGTSEVQRTIIGDRILGLPR